jgi:hypothetical protein
MKWLVLVSVPVLLTGMIFFGQVIDPPKKSASSPADFKKVVPVVNSRSQDSYPGSTGQDQTGYQTETDNDNRLLYKNIIVCIL